MPRCPNGHENSEGQRFCGECGLPLALDSTVDSSGDTATGVGDPTVGSVTAAGTPWRRRWPLLAIAAAAVVAVVLVIGLLAGGGGSGDEAGQTLRGTFVVFGSCGTGGYDDIYSGQQLVVRDRGGDTLAKGELGPERGDCEFPFVVRDIPEAEFYSVEVSHRGALTYSKEELEDMDWRLELSLGP